MQKFVAYKARVRPLGAFFSLKESDVHSVPVLSKRKLKTIRNHRGKKRARLIKTRNV